jgi:hypothetical protein
MNFRRLGVLETLEMGEETPVLLPGVVKYLDDLRDAGVGA